LEIRLNILSPVVDKFVLVEADRTFSNKEKPFFYEENKERYKRFLDRIIHIKITDYNFETWQGEYCKPLIKINMTQKEYQAAWDMEHYQRDQIARGLVNCSPDDIVIISDLDEIPNPEIIKRYKENGNSICKLEQVCFYYFLNYQQCGPNKYIYVATITRYKEIFSNDYTPDKIRWENNAKNIRNGGWHFSYLGGIESIKYKIQSFSHQEYNNENYINNKIMSKIYYGLDLFDKKGSRFIPVKINCKSHPEYIFNNINKYTHLIYPHVNQSIAIKNTLYCWGLYLFTLTKEAIIKILKKILPKSILNKIINIKKLCEQKNNT
jgi:beta-1,4-mannosyl-glycoprotein beta-1,4-N-acetylglucosaminyltransferase